ncbi:UDP-N-acetylmuramyl pentapeptide phosphotransferase [Microbacterium aureliae]
MSAQLSGTSPQTGAIAVVADATDPARRPDVLLRVRRDEGHELSPWWMIGAFVGVSVAVISLLSFVPGGA